LVERIEDLLETFEGGFIDLQGLGILLVETEVGQRAGEFAK